MKTNFFILFTLFIYTVSQKGIYVKSYHFEKCLEKEFSKNTIFYQYDLCYTDPEWGKNSSYLLTRNNDTYGVNVIYRSSCNQDCSECMDDPKIFQIDPKKCLFVDDFDLLIDLYGTIAYEGEYKIDKEHFGYNLYNDKKCKGKFPLVMIIDNHVCYDRYQERYCENGVFWIVEKSEEDCKGETGEKVKIESGKCFPENPVSYKFICGDE